MDWKAILNSDDDSFEGFPETNMVEYLVRKIGLPYSGALIYCFQTETCKLEARMDRFKVQHYLQRELKKIEDLGATIKQETPFLGFGE